jgi:ABC-type antimicrobial peptide transport system permease subunit
MVVQHAAREAIDVPVMPDGDGARPVFKPGLALRLPYPVRNVLRRWRGTIGMMIGVGIALGLSMTMLAMAEARIDIFTLEFRRSGATAYVVTEGGKLIPELISDTPGTIKRSRQVLSQIRRIPEVTTALGIMSWSMVREQEGPRISDQPAELIMALGVDGDPTAIANGTVLNSGRWLERPNEVVVGSKLSRDKGIEVGSTLRLSGRTFDVVGVGKMRGLGVVFTADAIAYMEYGAFRQRADVGDVFSTIIVQSSQPEVVRPQIEELGGLSVFTPADLVRQAEKANQAAIGIYWFMIGLTLAIASLFVGGMLGRSVAERRLEFAMLRAIGIPTHTILFTVGGEALLITVAAGALGIGFSLFLGFLLNTYVAPPYGLETLYSARASAFGGVVLLALGLGLVSGLLPARQATRVDPVDVLREA